MTLQKIKYEDREINYNLKMSKKARRMRLTIYCDGSLVATVPRRYSPETLESFILEKAEWILRKIEYFQGFENKSFWKNDPADYEKYKNEALALALRRVYYFNQFYGHNCANISIRNQKTRWGSCSRNGNLSFNYKIVFLPPHLADYIIVHEICHLRQFNHSADFWALVEKTIPNYRDLRREVRKL